MSKILPIGPDMGSDTTTRNNSAAGCGDDLVDDQEARVNFQLSAGILGEAEARHSSEIGPLDRGGNPLGRTN
jgi:hypothetical protein